MTVIAGLQATVRKGASTESTTAGWKVRDLSQSAHCPASNTLGGDQTTAGNSDWFGFYRNYGHTPIVFPGDTFAFLGSIKKPAGGAISASGDAICQRLTLHVPGEQGGNIQYQVELAGNGALTYGADSLTDSSNVAAVNAAGRKASWGGADAEVDVPETRLMRLAFGTRNRPYAGSGLPGVMRRVESITYAQWVYQCYTDDATLIPVRGSTGILRFYVTATTYWELKWVRVELIDEFGAEIEGQKNVGYTVAGSWLARLGTETGYIKDPSGVNRWP